MKYVLYSPVSDRDPCSSDRKHPNVYRDGAMLHIVRHYRPEKVYLFLTERFWAFERKDQRYTGMLEHVAPGIQVELIRCPETITNAALFDQFDEVFRKHLISIHEKHSDAQLLINVSSGTPQMQASLYLLAATIGFPVQAIQVLSPVGESNAGPKDYYNAELAASCLGEDGISSFEDQSREDLTRDRCRKVSCENAVRAILVENIATLATHYDYMAGLVLANKNKEFFTNELRFYLRLASCHLQLDREHENLKQLANKTGGTWDYFYEKPILSLNEEAQKCYDYLLYLETLVENNALSDYARALSPALTTIMRMRLAKEGFEVVDRFCERDKGGVLHLKNYKIRRAEPEFLNYLNNQFNGHFKDGPLSASHMLQYMFYLRDCGKCRTIDTDTYKVLRVCESDIRNLASHEMRGITSNDFNRLGHEDESSKTYHTSKNLNTESQPKGLSAKNILDMLKKEYLAATGIKSLQWDALQRMNEKITQELLKLPAGR